MMVGIALWQLGIFNLGGGSTTYTGFSRIKPQLPLTRVTSEGNFTGVFTNGGGGNIQIINVVGPCTFNPPTEPVKVGQNFMITGSDCPVSPVKGDVYDIELEIMYNLSAANMWVVHTDLGRLHGPIE
jgi:hypothetical protein